MAGTTADKLELLQNTKVEMKSAIESKGVKIEPYEAFSTYPSKIREIEVKSDPELAHVTISTRFDDIFNVIYTDENYVLHNETDLNLDLYVPVSSIIVVYNAARYYGTINAIATGGASLFNKLTYRNGSDSRILCAIIITSDGKLELR